MKMWYTRGFYSQNKIMEFAGKWVDLDHTLLSEVIHPDPERQVPRGLSHLWALVVLFSHGFRGFNSGLRSSCLQGQHCTDWAISPIHTHDSWSYIDFVQILAVMLFQMKYLDSFHSNFLICHLGQKKEVSTFSKSLSIKNMKIGFTDLIWC